MNFTPLMNAPLAVQLHVVAVIAAAAGILAVAMCAKGTRVHKWFGRTFVFGMAAAALTSFWIRELNHGSLSFIHIISLVTLFGLASGIQAARRREMWRATGSPWRSPRSAGAGVAGAFAIFRPGRVMWHVFFG